MTLSTGTKLALAVVVLLLVIGALWTFYAIFVKAPVDLAAATARGIEEVFQFRPRVTINQTVVIEANTPILEVATVSRQLQVDYQWSHTWLGSTKTLRLVGTFTAKAGFDLHEPFDIAIEKSPLRVKATLPPARMLSVTMNSYLAPVDESGWWNKISAQDREQAVAALLSTAHTHAEQSGMLEEVRNTAEQRITEIVQRNGATVEFARRGEGKERL
jgi:4-amino-4-deoxy-L-arabinose transferase-like glycosyltransferase